MPVCHRLLSSAVSAAASSAGPKAAAPLSSVSPASSSTGQPPRRAKSTLAPLDASKLTVSTVSPNELKTKPPLKDLKFGYTFTDHMLTARWSADKGWAAPHIGKYDNFSVSPAAKVFHYAPELFEGMKAYRGVDDRVRLFRPMHNMARMNVTAERACLPTFEGAELLQCIRKLIQIDQEWVPHCTSSSLYIRPTMIGTEPGVVVSPSQEALLFVIIGPVGPYFSTGVKPVNLLADPRFVRAWPGGCGFAKMGSNYGPTLWVGKQAEKYNCQQVLWLFGEDHEVTEVGAMNVFVFLEKDGGKRELVTPGLDKGIILPGVTRRSIIELTKQWGEFDVSERKITMGELMQAKSEGKLLEMFGAGTAAVVSPIGGIHYQDKMQQIPVPEDSLSGRLNKAMTDIYYGRTASPWTVDIEQWNVDPNQQIDDFTFAKNNSMT